MYVVQQERFEVTASSSSAFFKTTRAGPTPSLAIFTLIDRCAHGNWPVKSNELAGVANVGVKTEESSVYRGQHML